MSVSALSPASHSRSRNGFEWVARGGYAARGVVFLIMAGRAIYRLMKMNVRSFTLRMPRQREPAPPISSTDEFTWRGWWKQLLFWLKSWLAGSRPSIDEFLRAVGLDPRSAPRELLDRLVELEADFRKPPSGAVAQRIAAGGATIPFGPAGPGPP